MKNVRLGVVGCGAVAQVQHLPNLALLRDEFSVDIVSDLSPSLAANVAAEFHIPRHTNDLEELLSSDVDALYSAIRILKPKRPLQHLTPTNTYSLKSPSAFRSQRLSR